MILSFHSCFEADKTILCAGREPNVDDLSAIKAADAVILPQGCKISLFEMVKNNYSHVFPDYNARFSYPGKIGQIRLFQKTNSTHPKTKIYNNFNAFKKNYQEIPTNTLLDFPFVFEFNWGGKNSHVALIKSKTDFRETVQKTELYEKTGQKGFLIQEYIPSQNKTLKVVVMGRKTLSCWRTQENPRLFGASLSRGAVIDADFFPKFQNEAIFLIKRFCKQAWINLPGFDLLFSPQDKNKQPLFLEINYFFGRRGLGGSQ